MPSLNIFCDFIIYPLKYPENLWLPAVSGAPEYLNRIGQVAATRFFLSRIRG
jgi:hypothetical protein